MKSYEIASHTADVRILIRGDTIKSLFEAALDALISILQPEELLFDEINYFKIEISVDSLNVTNLLIDFLSTALTYMYIKKAIISKSDIYIINSRTLRATLNFYPIEEFRKDVKAVTYHEAEIKLNELNEYECTVVLDI